MSFDNLFNINFNKLRTLISRRGLGDSQVYNTLLSLFGVKFKRALEAVLAYNVVKLKVESTERALWVVKGKRSHYLVIPLHFCSCPDFSINITFKGLKDMCYHMLAQFIAEASGRYVVREIPKELVPWFIDNLIPSE